MNSNLDRNVKKLKNEKINMFLFKYKILAEKKNTANPISIPFFEKNRAK